MFKTVQVGILAPAVALACLALPGPAAQARSHDSAGTTGTQAKVTPSERTFIRKAAEGGVAEVQLGQLAQQKASSPLVKDFAQRMVTDHTKANDQLKQLATEEGVNIPDKLNAKKR